MWTYRHPHKPLHSTLESIRYHAQGELFRALNTGRTVAFVGSGLTLAYGRLSWSEFVRLSVIEADFLYCRYKKSPDQNVKSDADRIRQAIWQVLNIELADPKKIEPIPLKYSHEIDADTAVLQLCDELVTALGDPLFLRRKSELFFAGGNLQKFMLRILMLQGVSGYDQNSLLKRFEVALAQLQVDLVENKVRTPRKKSLSWIEALLEFEGETRTNLRSLLNRLRIYDEEMRRDDPIKEVFDRLNIHRFATLNYDYEIENFFMRHHDYPDPYDRGEAPLDPMAWDRHNPADKGVPAIPPHTIVDKIEDPFAPIRVSPFGRSLTAKVVEQNQLAEVGAFSVLPRVLDPSVVHLHGAARELDSQIVTEGDYQARYLRSGKARNSMQEALAMMFRGNNMVFLGIGMSEPDVMRPLRKFMADKDGVRRSGATAVAVMRGAPIWHKEKLDGANGDLPHSSLETIAKLERKQQAGQTIEAIRFQTQLGVKAIYTEPAYVSKPEDIYKKVGELLDKLEDSTDEDDAYLDVVKRRVEKESSPIVLLTEAACLAEANTMRLIALLKQLERRRQLWWRHWNELPKNRTAFFANPDRPENWMRHKLLPAAHVQRATIASWPKLEEFFANGALTWWDSPANRTAMIVLAPGGGRGSLTRVLQDDLASAITGRSYTYTFFADTRFSPEFNSVIVGLLRFLWGIYRESSLAGQGADVSADIKEILDGLDQTALIPALKFLLKRTRSNDSKILICVGGVDALCDKSGKLNNAVHKDFFEALADDTARSSDIDTILFSNTGVFADTFWRDRWRIHALKIEACSLFDGAADRRNWLVEWTPPLGLLDIVAHATIHNRRRNNEDPYCELSPDDWKNFYATEIFRLMRRRVVIDHWCRNYIKSLFSAEELPETLLGIVYGLLAIPYRMWGIASWRDLHTEHRKVFDELVQWFGQIDQAVTRRATGDIVGTILSAYHSIAVTDFSQNPDKASREIVMRREKRWVLQRVVMRHLVFFPIPVERAVLAACPEVRRAAKKLYNDRQFTVTPSKGWPASEKMLCEFLTNEVLNPLTEMGLIVRCSRSGVTDPGREGPEVARYTLHHMMRDFLGRKMGYPTLPRQHSYQHDVSLYPAESDVRTVPDPAIFITISNILSEMVGGIQGDLQYFVEFRWARYQKRVLDNRNVGSGSETFHSKHDASLKGDAAMLTALYGPTSLDIRSGLDDEKLTEFLDFKRYNNYCRKQTDLDGRCKAKAKELDGVNSISNRIRAVASIIQGGFPMQTVARLSEVDMRKLNLGETDCALDNYSGWIRGILNAAIAVGHYTDIIEEKFGETAGKGPRVRLPLYMSEIGWLYNERAIVAHTQGRMDDARAIFRLAIRLASDWRWGAEDSELMSTLWAIRLNQSIARMEAGYLRSAARRLQELLDYRARLLSGSTPDPSERHLVLELANGFMGVNDFYSGNFMKARERFRETLEYLQSVPQNLRGIAILRRFWGMTEYRLGHEKRGLNLINLSVEAANAGDHQDLVHLSSLAKAKVLIESAKLVNEDLAMDLVRQAEHYAGRMGIPRLEMLAKMTEGALMEKRKHLDHAGQKLSEAVAIANLNGLEIHKSIALAIYSKVLEKRGGDEDLELARRINDTNRKNAANMGFALSLHEPERMMS